MQDVLELYEDARIGGEIRRAVARARSVMEERTAPGGESKFHVSVLKYRPGRRACLRVAATDGNGQEGPAGAPMILKIWSGGRDQRIASRLQKVRGELAAIPRCELATPDVVFHDTKLRALAYRELPGRPLTALLSNGDAPSLMRRVGRALRSFHGAGIDDLSPRGAADEALHVVQLLDQRAHLRELDAYSRAVELLAARAPAAGGRAALHRDFYDAQIIIGPDGTPAFIDLDDMALGDPMLDAGNLIAHLCLVDGLMDDPDRRKRLAGAFLTGYFEACPGELGRSAVTLRWYTAIALARLVALQHPLEQADRAEVLLNELSGVLAASDVPGLDPQFNTVSSATLPAAGDDLPEVART